MIKLPIEIGDIILAGRFKNKKITVKEIGVDENNHPTINGRGILKIRIAKLMPPKEKKIESKLRSLLKRLIREESNRLMEIEVTDPELAAKLDEFAELERKYTQVKAAVDELMERLGYRDIENRYKELAKDDPIMWSFFMQVKQTGDNIIRTEKNIIEIKRNPSETETFSHKDAFVSALGKVNTATKRVLEEELEASKTLSKRIGAYSSQPNESKLRESNWLGKIKDWFVKIGKQVISRLKIGNAQISKNVDELEIITKKMMNG